MQVLVLNLAVICYRLIVELLRLHIDFLLEENLFGNTGVRNLQLFSALKNILGFLELVFYFQLYDVFLGNSVNCFLLLEKEFRLFLILSALLGFLHKDFFCGEQRVLQYVFLLLITHYNLIIIIVIVLFIFSTSPLSFAKGHLVSSTCSLGAFQ